MLRWVRSQWRWLLAFAMSMISQGVLMRFVEPTIPTWALAVWAVAYASSVMWLHESSVLDGRRDALREKVQRVERLLDRCDQDTYDFHWGEGSPVVLTQYVRDALDGGEPDE